MNDKIRKPTTQAWGQLLRAQRTAMEKVEADLKQKGFPPLIWYDVLLELQRIPDGSMRHRELTQKMLLPKHNLSRLIDRMEKQELVSRNACEVDKRGSFICITQKGRELRENMWPTYEAAVQRHFSDRFSREESEELNNLLARV